MNQTFNIKRFCRYTQFILSMNRWYYGVVLVFFTIPATVLSLCGVTDWLVAGLVGWSTVTINITPFADTAKYGGRARMLIIPASWVEKLVLEYIVRFLPIVVPFGLHAVGCAFGLNSVSGYLADGFDKGRIVEMLFWMSYMMLFLSFDSGKRRNNPILRIKQISTNWFTTIYMGFMLFLILHTPRPVFYNMLGTVISLTFSVLVFLASLVFYRRRHA